MNTVPHYLEIQFILGNIKQKQYKFLLCLVKTIIKTIYFHDIGHVLELEINCKTKLVTHSLVAHL